ncbi:SGNH/GDSL hydrolase family protein [Streptomyces roseicoloratus]|uniref:GDSL-type esterase/lipase family protein n=1 Tax=Streptomyces roseicoloratus TaxID=2508722 RepID=A0ABY9RYG4_9ACTN|nr:SGNH/GDSL hydrolase family protein [Streptomyces roseicoloratus]WMX47232.1 GDSL-type esterase/lipase family protein [Streptomyces roseicoloratus]
MLRGRHRFRAAAAGTALLCAVTALAGCSAEGGTGQGPHAASAAPKPRPTPPPKPVWNVSPGSVAAVGDSVTRAFDACAVLADCPEASWATGTDAAVNSLALRLLGPEKVAGRSWNLARSGARMAELPEQMAAAAAERPELVTVMMGANDACRPRAADMTPVEDFRASFTTALARLRAGAPKAQVYVSSVPDLRRLWETGRVSPMGRQVWKLGVCGSMLADPEDLGAAAEERRTRVRDRVVAYNEVLREVCAKDDRCRYDGGAVFGFAFGRAQLSPWDFFHPSRDGQARLAEIAYRQISRR